jgi:hypothetical protein
MGMRNEIIAAFKSRSIDRLQHIHNQKLVLSIALLECERHPNKFLMTDAKVGVSLFLQQLQV